jgi:hypothetical protein
MEQTRLFQPSCAALYMSMYIGDDGLIHVRTMWHAPPLLKDYRHDTYPLSTMEELEQLAGDVLAGLIARARHDGGLAVLLTDQPF